MDLRHNTREEILETLRTGELISIDVSKDRKLAKVLSYYIEQLEISYTRTGILSSSNSEWMFILNLPAAILSFTTYSYVRKLGYAWKSLKWIKVETDGVPPCKEFKLQYVRSKQNLPSSVWGT